MANHHDFWYLKFRLKKNIPFFSDNLSYVSLLVHALRRVCCIYVCQVLVKKAKKIVNFRRFVYCVHLAVLPARKQFFC